MTRNLIPLALAILVAGGALYAAYRGADTVPAVAVLEADPAAGAAQETEWDIVMAAGGGALAGGDFAEAERQFSLAMARAQGLNPHPALSASMAGLGAAYRAQNRLAESEESYRRTLDIVEEAVGPAHPDVAAVLMGLAKTVYWRSRDMEAEHLYDRALDIRLRTLGWDHLAVADTLEALADLYQAGAMEVDADILFDEAAQIRKRAAAP